MPRAERSGVSRIICCWWNLDATTWLITKQSFSSYKEQMKGGDKTGRWKETGTWKGLDMDTRERHSQRNLPRINLIIGTHTCPVTWTLSSLNKLQSPDVTCRHSQKLNTAHTHTHMIPPFLRRLCPHGISLSLCLFSISSPENVSLAKRDTKAIVLIQQSKPFRGFRGLKDTNTHTRTYTVMRFTACWTMSCNDTHTHTNKSVQGSQLQCLN